MVDKSLLDKWGISIRRDSPSSRWTVCVGVPGTTPNVCFFLDSWEEASEKAQDLVDMLEGELSSMSGFGEALLGGRQQITQACVDWLIPRPLPARRAPSLPYSSVVTFLGQEDFYSIEEKSRLGRLLREMGYEDDDGQESSR